MNKIQLNKYLNIAKGLIIKDGKLMPIAFLDMVKSEEPMILGLPEMPNDQRQRQYMFFRLGAKIGLEKVKTEGITFLSEVWYAMPSADKFKNDKNPFESKDYIRPSEDPNRKEAIMILSVDIKGKYDFTIQPFKKENKEIVFEKDEKMEMDGPDNFQDNLLKWFWRGYEAAPKAEEKIKEIVSEVKERVSAEDIIKSVIGRLSEDNFNH